MNEYIFYYHENEWDKIKENGSYIWHFEVWADSVAQALEAFLAARSPYTGDDRIIQIIVKSKLN